MPWGRQPRGTCTARPRRCLPEGRDRSQQHPRVWGGLGTLAAEAAPLPSPRHPARPEHAAPILPACLPGSPTASPVWRREELRLAALAAICTSRLWGRVAAPALRSPRATGNPAGGWQEAGERLAVTSALPRAAQPARPWEWDSLRGCSLGKALCHARPPALLGHRGPHRCPAQQGASSPRPRHAHGHGLGPTWHHTIGGDCAHGNGRQHCLQEETQRRRPAELPPHREGRAGAMRGRGAPQGHAETCHRAGTPGGQPGGWAGRQGCWLAAQRGSEPPGGTGSAVRGGGLPGCPGHCPCSAP